MRKVVGAVFRGGGMNTFMPDEMVVTQGPEQTRALAQRLAGELGPGSVLALHGEVGSGKTCFVQGLARALGVRGPISSPTFILVNEHAGRLPLFHVDLYRIRSEEEADTLAFEEYLESDGVTVVEWAERAAALWPARTVHLYFQIGDHPDTRLITIRRPCPAAAVAPSSLRHRE